MSGEFLPFTSSVDRSAGITTVAVRGEPDYGSCSQMRALLAQVSEQDPELVVLDLGGIPDRCAETVVAIIGSARQSLPSGCQLAVRAASPTVWGVMAQAEWP